MIPSPGSGKSEKTVRFLAGINMILDTSILIYAAAREFPEWDVFLSSGQFAASVITRIEALGFTRRDETEKTALNALFAKLRVLPLSDTVANQAIDLRQQRKMSLADAIIAATALVHGLPLVTRNVGDYKHIAEINIINPFELKAS